MQFYKYKDYGITRKDKLKRDHHIYFLTIMLEMYKSDPAFDTIRFCQDGITLLLLCICKRLPHDDLIKIMKKYEYQLKDWRRRLHIHKFGINY